MEYIVPEYYKHFVCKCGDCRKSCCDGWPITISQKEYYYLIGVACSDELRGKLDCALKLSPVRSTQSYAVLSGDWHGNCKLHLESGLCALQTELGAEAIPAVCRLYPRSTKKLLRYCECSCSNSCEQVVELLMDIHTPLRFEEVTLSQDPVFEFPLTHQNYESFKHAISIMQNRSLSLGERFLSLHHELYGSIISSPSSDLSLAFQVVSDLTVSYENNETICEYCRETLRYFGLDEDHRPEKDYLHLKEKYDAASCLIEKLLPDWPVLIEQLLINHMIYNDFIYTTPFDQGTDAYISLVLTYSFLRFHILGILSNGILSSSLVDFLVSMFRLIDHSNFKSVAVALFKNRQLPAADAIAQLVFL